MEINIIWIEDNQEWQENQERELKEEVQGFRLSVKYSKHGEKIENLLDDPVDFVLCDWRLKEKNNNNNLAVDLIKKVRNKNKYCRIIFYSGYLGNIEKEQLVELIKSNICRFVERKYLTDVVKEEISSGLTIVAIIDKWLTYFGRDKKKFTFSALGEEFKDKDIRSLLSEIRKGSIIGQRFTRELTKFMLSMVGD